MTIYRGPGGASETTDSATISAVQTYASQAAASATAAASSASTAATNATAAASSASAASTSVTNAATQVSAAAAEASNAATSATEAAASASDASTSAASALSYANAASGHATDANGYKNNAQTYMDRAETAADSAIAIYDEFDDRYLGVFGSDPTTDNDGDALVTGALYFNTAVPEIRVYDGSDWTNFAAGASVSSFNERTGVVTLLSTDVNTALGYTAANAATVALKANNLSDLASASTARTNLGLGTAATTASTDYATAAQGAKADTAVQPAAIANMLETSDIGVSVQAYSSVLANTTASFTTADETKLDGIAAGAEVNVNADWNASSGDAQILNKPTAVSAFTNDAGYLTSETDPVFVAHASYNITSTNISNWNTAYGWGNHASAGYLTSSSTIDGGSY